MKPSVLAVLFALLLTPLARAEEKPQVHVQFTYVDTPLIDDAMQKTLPSAKYTTGDALHDFLRLIKNAHLHNKVTVGPELVADNRVRTALDKSHPVPAASIGRIGADWLLGPRLALTPTIVKGDLVSVVLHISDMEIVGPDGYWFKTLEDVDANAPPVFKAHSGSTILLGGCYSSHKVERFTFATVTILPPSKK